MCVGGGVLMWYKCTCVQKDTHGMKEKTTPTVGFSPFSLLLSTLKEQIHNQCVFVCAHQHTLLTPHKGDDEKALKDADSAPWVKTDHAARQTKSHLEVGRARPSPPLPPPSSPTTLNKEARAMTSSFHRTAPSSVTSSFQLLDDVTMEIV